MTKVQELQEQAARAERLARSVLDGVTIERLMAFAAECREKMAVLNTAQMIQSSLGTYSGGTSDA